MILAAWELYQGQFLLWTFLKIMYCKLNSMLSEDQDSVTSSAALSSIDVGCKHPVIHLQNWSYHFPDAGVNITQL